MSLSRNSMPRISPYATRPATWDRPRPSTRPAMPTSSTTAKSADSRTHISPTRAAGAISTTASSRALPTLSTTAASNGLRTAPSTACPGGSYITAAADASLKMTQVLYPQLSDATFYAGLFFNRCHITAADGVANDSYYLGRPWKEMCGTRLYQLHPRFSYQKRRLGYLERYRKHGLVL